MSRYIRNKHNYISLKTLVLVLFFFLAISVLFFRGIIFSKGLVVSSDWMIPLSSQQMETYIERQFYTWTHDMNLFGVKNPFFVSLPFVLLVKIFLLVGLNGEILSKALITIVFTLSGISMFLLLRFLGLKKPSALVGGFIFITMPVFFDYAIMGWCFVLFAVGTVLPITVICFIKSVEEKKTIYSVISGLLFSIAILQSQSIVWFPMVFLALSVYLIKDKETFFSYIKSISVIILIALALHTSWWPNLILSRDPGVMNSDLGLDPVSLGMRSRLSVVNILRAWGGLFNYQYEISYPKSLMPISFLISLMAIASLLLRKVNKRDLRIPMVIILFYMVILFLINPSVMAKIPFANLIRDIGRFTALTSFAYTILASFFLGYLLESGDKKKKVFAFFLLFLIFLNSFSFFSGKLYGDPQNIYDTRLRTYKFPEDYYLAENYLYKIKSDVKSYYPPSGTNIGIKNQPRFDTDFKEIKDPFRGYSPIPGTIYMYYSSMGKPPEISFLLDSLFNENHSEKSLLLMGMMNIEDIIIRTDINYPEAQKPSIQYLLSNTESKNLLNFGKVQIVKNKYFLPHFYIPENIIYSNGNIESLVDIVSFDDYQIRSGIYLDENGEWKMENGELLNRADEVFMKAELENPVDKDYFEKLEAFKNNVPFPFVKHEPGSFFYPLFLKKEQLDEWRVRKDPGKLIEKKLFYAGKRISEMEKWGKGMDLDKAFERYRDKMEEAIWLLKETDWENEKIQQENVLKFQTNLDAYWQKIEDLKFSEKGVKIFADLKEEISYLRKKYDLSKLVYDFEIPEDGNYQLFIKNEKFNHYFKKDELNLEFLGEERTIPLLSENEKWISGGSFKLERGKKELSLTKPQTINLLGIDDWRDNLTESIFVKNEMITAPNLQLAFTEDSTLYFKTIENYQGDALYRISSDYFASGGEAGIVLIEDIGIKKKELRIKQELSVTSPDLPRHFEKIFKSTPGAETSEFYFWGKADNNRESRIKFFNVKVERVFEPTIILRSTNYQLPITNYQLPGITFIKINPTKYRVKIEGAKEPYTLVFSESFHQGWKAYISNQGVVSSNQGSVNSNQQYGEEVASYFEGGIKEGTHKNIFLDRNTFETWRKKPISEEKHSLVNGYANSWYITPEDAGGKQDYELIIEFAPQKLFYIGLFISILTLVGCLGYLIFAFFRKK